jgi:hypothetical protein
LAHAACGDAPDENGDVPKALVLVFSALKEKVVKRVIVLVVDWWAGYLSRGFEEHPIRNG